MLDTNYVDHNAKEILCRFNELDVNVITEVDLFNELNDYVELCEELGEEEYKEAIRIKKDVLKNGLTDKAKRYVDYIALSGESVGWHLFKYYEMDKIRLIKYAMNKIGIKLSEDMIHW